MVATRQAPRTSSRSTWLLDTTTRSHEDELRRSQRPKPSATSSQRQGQDSSARSSRTIIRAWGSLHSLATQAECRPTRAAPIDFNPQNARRTLRAWSKATWVATLQKLTGVSHSKLPRIGSAGSTRTRAGSRRSEPTQQRDLIRQIA